MIKEPEDLANTHDDYMTSSELDFWAGRARELQAILVQVLDLGQASPTLCARRALNVIALALYASPKIQAQAILQPAASTRLQKLK